ncbi:MAG: AI-2E family transporter [Cytophagales bacterium]|nr:AI-2E family transporter [Cytophagales bacterium]
MERLIKIPFYVRTALIFINLFAFTYAMYIGRSIIVPIVFAFIIAILLNPFVNYLTKKKINRLISISMAVSLAFIVLSSLFYLFFSRLDSFTESYPQLKKKFETTNIQAVRWVSKTFNIREWKINAWSKESKSDAIEGLEIGKGLKEIGKMFVNILLVPVYLFMILYYKQHLLTFIHKIFESVYHIAVREVLDNSKAIIQRYLVGLFIEMIIMAILNSVGLLFLGIQYAIILGIIGAVLNIIPYIGGIVATSLAMIIAFVTKDSLSYPLLVLLLYIVIQFIDNNYIVPKIVASRVQLNALISIIVVLVGGALWGILRMFLSIPLTAILKVILDHIEPLKPWGFLLGECCAHEIRTCYCCKTRVVHELFSNKFDPGHTQP